MAKHGELTHNVKLIIARDFHTGVFSIQDLWDKLLDTLPTANYSSLYGIFSKLVKNGVLTTTHRGVYSATQTTKKLEEPDRKLSYDEIGRGVSRLITRLEMENEQLTDDLAKCQKQLHKLQAKCNEMLQNSDLNLKDIT